MSRVKPRDKVVEGAKKLIEALHEQYGWFNNEELENTPVRIAKFFEEFWLKSQENVKEKMTVFESEYGGMVIDVGIDFKAFCSHHLLPVYGEVIVAYIPKKNGGKGKYLGLSKLGRIVKRYAYQPIMQEETTRKILNDIVETIDPEFAMVVIVAKHMCKVFRGVEDENSVMVTAAIYPENEVGYEMEKKVLEYVKIAEKMKIKNGW